MAPEISNNFTKYSCYYKHYVYSLYFIWFKTYIYPNFKISGDHQVDVIWVANTHTSTHMHFYPFLFKILEYAIILYSDNNIWLFNYTFCAAAAAKSLQSCPTLRDPIDSSPPGAPVPGILQTRTLEWIAISFSNAWKWKVKVKSLYRAQLLATPWTAAFQAPQSMGFSRQEYWSGVPLPSPNFLCRDRQTKIPAKSSPWSKFANEVLLEHGSVC